MTRRELAAVALASAARPAAAQSQAATPPADELQAARDRIKANGDTLAQQAVPMTLEPAFQFKA